jgi:hypothetical protein
MPKKHRTYSFKSAARGTPENGNDLKIAVSFRADDFARLSSLAKRNGISFREQVRRLCFLGLREGRDV